MKLNTIRRGTAAAAVLALSVSLAACSSEDDTEGTAAEETTSAEETPAEETPSEEAPTEEESAAEGDPAAAVFGDACSQVPADGAGSFNGMVTEPVANAASANPLLETLVTAVGAVDGLADTLNSAPALTVFAPYNEAFGVFNQQQLNGLIEGAQADGAESDLAKTLSHHVLGENLTADAIAGEQETLNMDTLTVEGDAESGMTVSDGTVTANVLCGNIPTANATVYVIDQVLTGIGS